MPTPNATAADAQLILQLYDLRREAEMRKARKYCDNEFWPENYQEFHAILMAWDTQEHTWLHQVLAYWDMAASLVLRGALNPDLFADNSHQMYFLYAKLKPFLQPARKEMEAPEYLANISKLVESTAESRERLRRCEAMVAKWGPEVRAKLKSSRRAA
jgi:hypothetical protein